MKIRILNHRGIEVFLSEREFQVLKLIALGKVQKQIASDLGTSTHTISGQIETLRRKIGPLCYVELTHLALARKLISNIYELPQTSVWPGPQI